MPGDANGRAVRTMGWPARPARLALPATAIDFADYTAAGVRTVSRNADKLVAQHAIEAHITADQLEIGLANPCREYPDSRFAVLPHRFRTIRGERHMVAIEHEGTHSKNLFAGSQVLGSMVLRFQL